MGTNIENMIKDVLVLLMPKITITIKGNANDAIIELKETYLLIRKVITKTRADSKAACQ